MTLKPGTQLGPYEVVAAVGAGGMGEVYRARDPRVGRDVALKVSAEQFTDRFEREIRAVASLNHSNICTLYDVGSNYLVMELVEGPTLADRIKQGPIPLEESLAIARQIADALEAAHEKGIVHRDLKPANIKIKPDGTVKVLDFGLAKVGGTPAVISDNSPTLSVAQTAAGVILGTAAYMSPEQAKGKQVDKRADVWAFGVVLYEMLTGKHLFQGDDVSEILASVIKADVNLDQLSANTHPRLRELLSRCLQKDLKKRYQDIGDVRIELEQILANPERLIAQPAAQVGHGSRLRFLVPWVAATAIIAAIIGGVADWKLRKTEPPPVVRFSDVLPENQILTVANRQNRNLASRHAIAISPDGSRLVYSTTGGLCLRSLDRMDARIIPGTEGEAAIPFFSPDGRWVGFWSAGDRRLKKIPIAGGSPVIICNAENSIDNAIWNADNTIVYDGQGRIMRVSANGGTPATILEGKDELFWDPQLLPDGKTLLFTFSPADRQMNMKIAVQSLKSGKRRVLFAGQSARYLPTGHLAYVQDPTLFAIPFDPGKSEVTGGPVPMIQDIYMWGNTHYAVSDSGVLVYVPGIRAAQLNQLSQSTLVWVDRNGKEEAIAAPPNTYAAPKISPDGTRVALTVSTVDKPDIWIRDLARGTMTRLTFDEPSRIPLWTADGKRIAFMSERNGTISIYWKAADGTGKDEKLGSEGDFGEMPRSWSKDGKTLILSKGTGGGAYDIMALSMEGGRKLRPLLNATYNENFPQVSPDGRWMSYLSDESGENEVYVRPFPEVDGGRWQVSTSGGTNPLWSPDGRDLFYRSGDAAMAVSVKIAPTFSFETPKILFHGRYSAWDISPDGKRFLMIKPSEAAAPAAPEERSLQRINIVLNWFEELKPRVK
jgi:eukaryotic-like serine/threonine-protein kinase